MAQSNNATDTILTMILRSKTSRSAVVIGLLVSMVLLSTAVPLGALAQENGEDEPNDDRLAATPIQGTQVSGNVEMQSGVDWFSVEAARGEEVSFVLTKAADAQGINISMHSPDGERLDNTSSFDGALRAEVETTAQESGTYYLKVDGIHDKAKGIPYKVYTPGGEAPPPEDREIPSITEESEPNNPSKWNSSEKDGEPNRIPTNTKISGKINYGEKDVGTDQEEDVDKYSFYATKGDTVSIVLTTASERELTAEYRRPDQDYYSMSKMIINLYSGDTRGQVSFIAQRTGLYYIKVEPIGSYVSKNTGSYSISAHIKQSSRSTTQTDSSGSGTDNVTDPGSSTSTDENQQSRNNADNEKTDIKQNKNNVKTTNESEVEGIPLMMIGIGSVIGGILVALIMGAAFLIYQQ